MLLRTRCVRYGSRHIYMYKQNQDHLLREQLDISLPKGDTYICSPFEGARSRKPMLSTEDELWKNEERLAQNRLE